MLSLTFSTMVYWYILVNDLLLLLFMHLTSYHILDYFFKECFQERFGYNTFATFYTEEYPYSHFILKIFKCTQYSQFNFFFSVFLKLYSIVFLLLNWHEKFGNNLVIVSLRVIWSFPLGDFRILSWSLIFWNFFLNNVLKCMEI